MYQLKNNLCISSYNCKGFKYRNYNYLQKLFDKSDVLLIQEHWLYDFEFGNFSNVLTGSKYIAKSDMQNDVINYGRPYGGVAIIWKKSLVVEINEINTLSNRLCAIRITSHNLDIILVNIYMPCNEYNLNDEFIEILFEVVTICNTYECSDIVIAGDFNCDISLNDVRAHSFADVLTSLKLDCLTIDSKFNINYTFMNSLNSKSLIDHFCVSKKIYESVISFAKCDDGDNLSDHLPLILKFSTNINHDQCLENNNNKCKEIKVNWSDANVHDIENYVICLDKLLNEIHIPFSALNCLNNNCKLHRVDYESFLNKILDSIELATLTSIPVKIDNNNNKSRNITGWNDYIKQYQVKALLWHKIWKSNDSPAVGFIADIRRKTRNDYHKAIKDLKNNQDNLKRFNVGNALQFSNPKYFWNEVNKLNRKTVQCSSVIDGQTGEAACNVFKNKYETLYGEGSDDNIDDLALRCQSDIDYRCKDLNENNSSHLHYVTPLMVNKAIKMLKNDKSDINNFIYSNAFLKASFKLSIFLSFLFTIMIRHSFTNQIFNIIYFKPLVKNKRESSSNSNNYRAIALSSLIGKILDYVLINHFDSVLQSNSRQFAYKKDNSTTLCSYVLMEVVQYYKQRNSNVIATFLDCSKAFDKIRFSKLFDILICKGMCPLITKLLLVMYSNIDGFVKWNDFKSDKIKIWNGVRQGGVISPLLFALYLDILIERLINTNVGCFIGRMCISVLVYADDIVLLSPTRKAMMKLLSVCELFGEEFSLVFNSLKSEFIQFGKNKCTFNLFFNNENIKNVSEVKHLGHNLLNKHYLLDLMPLIKDLKTKTNVILSNFHFLDFKSKIKIFNTNCSSFYGSVLTDLQSNKIDELDRAWRVCVRKVLNLNKRTHCNLLPYLINAMPPSLQIFTRIITFFIKGLKNESEFIYYVFRNCLVEKDSIMFNNLMHICTKLNLNIDNLLLFSKNEIKKRIITIQNEVPNWKVVLIREILSWRDKNIYIQLTPGELEDILDFLCTG